MVLIVTTQDEFDQQLEKAGAKLVVVDFFAEWCGPCRMIAPKIEEMEKQMADVVFLKIDVDQAAELAESMGIEAMPTFKLFKNKSEVETIVGASEGKIQDAIKKHK